MNIIICRIVTGWVAVSTIFAVNPVIGFLSYEKPYAFDMAIWHA